ncbi:MAG: phospholipase [Clostridia bacterium]|nr:phospholipase [Clostridia bacterium]
MYEKLYFNNPLGQSLPYLKYTPSALPEGGKYPLLVFMHGHGECGPDDGSEVDLVAKHGWLRNVAEGEEFPFMIVAPQCPRGQYWGTYIESVNRFLDHILEENEIDESRIYLTGLSMGGTATWLWGMSYGERFAALAPVCGEGITWYGGTLAGKPVWAFHGDCDATVSPHESLEMVSRINKRGGHARLTLLAGVKHNAWDYAYNDELVAWFMEQTLTEKTNE